MVEANAASSDGSVIAGSSSGSVGGILVARAARWTSSGVVQIGTLPGHVASNAESVSDDGSTLVGGSLADRLPGQPPTPRVLEAFRWTSVSGMVGLGDLPDGEVGSEARAVSADGSVVVGYGTSASGREAFRWTSAGGMLGLGDLPGGDFYSIALGVSADGSVVVGTGDSESTAFIWDATHGLQNLEDLLVDLGLDLTGWDLTNATGISADGLTIVGSGRHNDTEEAWIAVIPEPGTGVLLMTGLLALAGRRRGSRHLAG